MPNLNKVFLMGNLTRDPELRYTPNGTAVCDFSLAINRQFNDASGQKRDETTFLDCTAFGKRGEVISEYMKKGRPLFVEGRIRKDTWVGKEDGQRRSKFSIIVDGFQFIDSRGGASFSGKDNSGAETDDSAKQDTDDDIPF